MKPSTIVLLCALVSVACDLGPRDNRPAEVKAAAARVAPATSPEAETNQARADYLKLIALSKVSSERGTSLGRPIGFVNGEIKNNGDRSVDLVEVTIYLLNASGRAIHEGKSHPILVNEFTRQLPLKPNYARQWAGSVEDVPAEWDGRVEVKVTDVVFSPAQ